jgi:D-alanyl-D-alanine carboxypeptidase/D-alanyl-D-alanine-endopeptidase (penicillin-binding protein 4)
VLYRFGLALALTATISCAANASPGSPGSGPRQTDRSAAAVRELRTQLTTVFNAPVMARGVWGVEVRSLDRGDILFSLNAGKLMMPASNMKILTLAATAEALGWDYRFTTTLETTAPVDAGVLRGDLIVRGTGDPTISTRGERGRAVFDEWTAALRAAGISSIEGGILGNDEAFDDEGIGPGWSWDYLEAGYAAPIGALQYNDNTADLTTAPGAAVGDPIVVQLSPGSGFTVTNRGATIAGAESRQRGSINVHRRIDRPELEVSGTIPRDAPPATRAVAVLNPTQFFVQSLKDALIARGITISGPASDMDDLLPSPAAGAVPPRVLATTASPPLRDLATVLMKVSQNQYAETLLKALGAGAGGVGTTAGGRRAAQQIFTGWGIPADGYVVSDGSGLSRYNYVTAATINTILARLHADLRHREAFIATLPVAGQDGTISSRMRRSRAEGNAVAKTGSIANTRALSGYVRTRTGETLAFSILANDFVIPAATVTWIADLAVEILADFGR